ncbi:centromere protein F isoform X2 [Trichomycterus rosablanca]|uniref:centromere protein F isoform X2 n=1 Tax=Trichomycterus rosablanca TaxID=2290929 RepID=UPI002F35A709
MSWATDNWTAGLSGRVLQKVQEIQSLNDKLNRERQQRQLQLDNSEAALNKQKQKYEEVHVELAAVKRELVGMQEQVQVEARARERLAQELQAKVAQVCSLEGQLDAQKTQSQNLTLEVKRLEAMLEKLQKENVSGDTMLFSTPSWTMNSPWEQSGKTGLGGEGDSQAYTARQLQFGDSPKASVGAVSSPFPQQPHTTPPPRRRVHQSDSHTPSAVFPWERDDTRSTLKGRPTSSSTPGSLPINNAVATDAGLRDDRVEEALRKEVDGLRVRVSGLQQELQLEKECHRETESRLVKAQKDVNTNEQNLTRSRDELARAQTRITQEGDRAQAAEQRVKKLQEELKCQRQNAETSRCNAEQRRKEMEREHQRELLELQKERQSMERQHQQETNKLNQEIQQARTLHNALQTQYDKLVLQKQAVEKDLDEVQGKLKNTQADLTETQKRETQLQAKLMESLRENDGLRVSLEQLKKREKSLEEEVKRLTEELADALRLIKELQARLAAPPPQVVTHSFTPVAGDGFSSVRSIHSDQSPPRQHSVQRKRAPKTERPKAPDRPELVSYPFGREPGEGIDSEHISEFVSEGSAPLNIRVQEGNQHVTGRSVESEIDSSITEQDTGIEDTDTDSYMSDSISERIFKDYFNCESEGSKGSSSFQKQKRDSSALVELKKENTTLRDELKDIKKELQQRLEDLESQRRAETEARTKLKQLSKKFSSQTEQHCTKAQELKEKENKLEAQLELERKESAALKEVVATLEKETEKRNEEIKREEAENKEETFKLKEALSEMERKEEELKDEKEKMHKELEELQSVLLQERTEREREKEEEKKLPKINEMERLKIAELQAELDRLQNSCMLEDKSVKDNMPLTYLQLGNQTNTTNDVTSTTNTNVILCESGNLQNTMLSEQTTVTSLITECETETKSEDHSSAEQNSPSAISPEQQKKTTEISELDSTTVLVLEVERLRVQRDKEAEKAKKSQQKLEALQNQVNNQTKQLTSAFENQSKHIEGLLRGLQERDAALERQGEELQSCLKELALLKSEKQMREISNKSSNTEQPDDVSLEPDCSLVISKCTSSTDEVPKQDDSHSVNDKSLQSDNQHSPNLEVEKIEQGNAIANLDSLTISNVTLSTQEHVSLPTSDDQGADFTNRDENAAAQEPLTPAQEGTGKTLDHNIVNTESSIMSPEKPKNPLEILQRHLENHTGDLSVLKPVIDELQKMQNELAVLKAKNEVSTQNYLAIKQENEHLKLKLKQMKTEPCLAEEPPQTQDGSQLTNTNREECLAETQAGHLVDNLTMNEKPSISAGAEDKSRDIRTEQKDDENAAAQKLQEPLTTAQEGTGATVDLNTVETESSVISPDNLENPLEILQSLLKNHSGDISAFKPVIDKLHEAQNDLVTVKAKNDHLTVQLQEVSTQDYLAIKQENEHLKLKLKQMDTEPCLKPPQKQDGSQLTNTNKEECLAENQAGHLVDALSSLTEKPSISASAQDESRDIRTKQADNKNAAAQKPQEPLTTAQECTAETVDHNTVDTESSVISPDKPRNPLEILQSFLENHTGDLSVLKPVIDELYKTQNELIALKAKNDQQTLQLQEVSTQDYLSIKQENEHLNQAGHSVDSLSSLNEKPSISTSYEDEARDIRTEQADDENAAAQKPQEPLTTAQEGTGETVYHSTVDTERPDKHKKPSEILQRHLENHTGDLKPVIDELHKTQNELAILKAKNDQLTLQLQEVSTQDYLSIKQENEHLKSKLKQMDTEPFLAEERPQTQGGEKQMSENQAVHLVDDLSSLTEKPSISASAEDESMDIRTEQKDDENTAAQKLQEPLTTAQQGTAETVDHNTVDTESSIISPGKPRNPLEILQSFLENHTGDLSALKPVIDELYKTQNELIVLKAKNDQQTLQLQEVSTQDYLSIKQENEHLKSKLKQMETEPCLAEEPPQTQDGSQFTNTNREECLAENQAGHLVDNLTSLNEKPSVSANAEDEAKDTRTEWENVNQTGDLKSIIDELHKTQNELAILNAKNEVSTQNYLAIKQENEHLKLKLKQMETETCVAEEPPQTQDGSPLVNTNKEKCLAKNQAGHLVDNLTSLSEKPRISAGAEDKSRDIRTEQADNKNAASQKLQEPLTTAQKGSAETVDHNTVDTESSVPDKLKNPSEILQRHLENHTGDLKPVIDELHKTQNELAILKAKNDQLTLQLQEVSTQDYLALKQENEHLKLKLKQMETEPCLAEEPPQTQDGSQFTNTNREECLAENQAGHSVNDLSSLNTKPRVSASAEDKSRDIRTEQKDDENTAVQTLQDPLTTAQEGTAETVDHNTVDTESSVISPDKLKNSSEILLHKTQNELAILKAKNDQLTLQLQEVSTQDYLALKQENKHLKLKLKQMDSEPSLAEEPPQTQDGSQLTNTNREECLAENQAGHLVDALSSLNKKPSISAGAEDKSRDIRIKQADDENAAAQKPQQPLTTAQEGTRETVDHNTVDTESSIISPDNLENPLEILQSFLENHTGDLSALKPVIEELYKTQNELIVLKAKNDQLTLQLQEVSTQDYLAVKQENEHPTLKLKQMDTEPSLAKEPPQTQDGSQLTNTNKEECLAENQAGHLVDDLSSLNKKPRISESAEDEARGIRTEKEDDENAAAQKLQGPLTTAQEGTGETVYHNTVNTESSVLSPDKPKNLLEILQSFLENHTGDLSAFKPVIDELYKTQNELILLKDKNDQQTLQLQEVSTQDYLSIKQENEHLKLKLKQTDTETCLAEEPPQKQCGSPLTNQRNKNKCMPENQAGLSVDDLSSLTEKLSISASAEDESRDIRTEQKDDENTAVQILQEPLTTAQEGTAETVDHNTVDTESSVPDKLKNPSEILQRHLENHTGDLKPIIDELHKTQNELAILKAKNDQLTLQLQEVSTQDYLALKQENEHLKLKLKQMETEPCLAEEPPQTQDGSQFTNTNREECLAENQAGHSVNDLSSLNTKPRVSASAEDKSRDIRTEQKDDENTAVQTLQEPLTTAQEGTAETVDHNTVDTESSVISPDELKNSSEILLHKTQNELAILKAKNDQLTLQLQEVSTQDYLALKQENEHLKLKLKQMDSEPSLAEEPPQTQDGSQLTNTNREECLAENQAGHLVDALSSLNKKPSISAGAEDKSRDIRIKQADDENAAAQKPQQPLTTAQEGTRETVDHNTVDTESSVISPEKPRNPSEILQSFLKNHTGDLSAFKPVIDELQKMQNELIVQREKNDQPTLQLQEVSTQDYLAIKQENEHLKLKLKQMETEPCLKPPQLQDGSQLLNTNKEVDDLSSLNEKPSISASAEDEAKDIQTEWKEVHEKSENKTWPSLQDHSLQEKLQDLKTQLQILAEENRQQAEELELWRISAMSPGETMDQQSNNKPIVLVQEGQLVLSCSPTVLHTNSRQSRNMVQLEGYSAHQRHNQSFSEQTTGDLQPILKATEPMALDDGAITDVNVHIKMEVRTIYGSCTISSSKTDSDDDHTVTNQIKQMGPNRDAEVAKDTVNQLLENAFRPESQDGSASTTVETKDLDPKLQIKPADRRDLHMSSFTCDEVVMPVVQQSEVHKSTPEQGSEHVAAPVLIENNAVTKRLVVDQDQRSDFFDVTFGPYQAVIKEVKSVCTQTEQNSVMNVEDSGACSHPQQKLSILHASTQTDTDQIMEKKKHDSDVTESPPLSPTPASVTKKLLFSGAFPIPSNPAHLAERIRRNRSRMSAAYDDTEYEPYGLPEVVMKGFADIPSGPACPYVLRRGLLGTDALPLSLREPLLKEDDEDTDP